MILKSIICGRIFKHQRENYLDIYTTPFNSGQYYMVRLLQTWKYILHFYCTCGVMGQQLSLLACPLSIVKIIFFICIFFQCSCVCSGIERNSSCKEFHTLAPIKVVNFNPKFVVFLRWTTSLLLPLKHFTFLIKYYTTKQVTYIFR